MNKRNLIASSLGNLLEWFDFGLFIYLAPIIGAQFFPTSNPKMSTLIAFGVFSAGFIFRPLGGAFAGHMGDRYGRVKTLRLSILFMTLPTFLVGMLPNYQAMGITASVLLILFRMLQGLSVGGEYIGAMIYLAESAPNKKRGFFTSFAVFGANLGFLFATCIAMFLTELPPSFLNSWGWRIPFLLGGAIGLLLLYFRLKLAETPAYLSLQTSHHIEKRPLLTALRYAPVKLLQILGLTCMSGSFYFVFFGYMPTYLAQFLNVPFHLTISLETVSLALMLLLVPIMGYCSDRFGRKKLLFITVLGMIFLSLPCFYLLQQKTLLALSVALGVATLISSIDQGNTLVTIVENCPANIRYSGVGIAYNLGNALFASTAPLLVNILTQVYGSLAPAYYLMAMSMISLLVILSLRKTYARGQKGIDVTAKEAVF